jgi:hypothetical protein
MILNRCNFGKLILEKAWLAEINFSCHVSRNPLLQQVRSHKVKVRSLGGNKDLERKISSLRNVRY